MTESPSPSSSQQGGPEAGTGVVTDDSAVPIGAGRPGRFLCASRGRPPGGLAEW